MNGTRKTEAAFAPLAVLVLAMLGGCGGGAAAPGAAPSSVPSVSASPTGAATTSPGPSRSATAPAARTSPPAPSATVVLSRVTYQWGWPNAHGSALVTHTYPVPPLPQLVRIAVGDHPRDPGERPFNRMTFTFTTAFPTYRFAYTGTLTGSGSGQTVPLKGAGVLTITFSQAQAHTADGSRSSITAQPGRDIALTRIVDYAQAGDFEGVVTYGLGIAWPIPQSNPQIAVRAYETETITGGGQHLYAVAFDVDATNPAGR
ncbi:hypothetical protein KGA66_19530 [Actinocrinis puniceicyclus]|uniref:AMIN-like domain-containing protein n=1 Tax=Actinocrinis puniceicyclus TaxID=977794 RepID=A0A8J7WT84_9ACTN|nr:hypothetical protein [Actinocrinis puniceicyclus]MBS2965250.1 hypothetical protein [Actinocrinis puniceicyclus]